MSWLRKALKEEEFELAEPTELRSIKEIAKTAVPDGSLLSLIKNNQWIKDERLTQAPPIAVNTSCGTLSY